MDGWTDLGQSAPKELERLTCRQRGVASGSLPRGKMGKWTLGTWAAPESTLRVPSFITLTTRRGGCVLRGYRQPFLGWPSW